jgi:hypothetical protein
MFNRRLLFQLLSTNKIQLGIVIHDLMIAAEEDSKVRHELIKIYEKTITSLDSRSPDDPLIRAVSKCYNKTNVFDMMKQQKGKLDGEYSNRILWTQTASPLVV